MSANTKLVTHCGGIRRTREELATLETPTGTNTWRPVPHAELVAALHDGLTSLGVQVVREDFCTMGQADARMLGTLDLRIGGLDTDDFRMGLGLRAGNDRKVSIQFVAACRVFVCDNWAFSGSDGAVFLKRKHTRRLDVRASVLSAVEQFMDRAAAFRLDIDRMRNHSLIDCRAKEVIHDAFSAGVVPLRLFPTVHRLYFDDEVQRAKFPDRTAWSLNNAFTEAVKSLRAGPQQQYGLRIGRLFGKVVDSGSREPIGVVDGIAVYN